MNYAIIITLGIILLLLFALNKIRESETSTQNKTIEIYNCPKTQFGCCPDGVKSRIDYFGSNCPIYNPGPGYTTPILTPNRHPEFRPIPPRPIHPDPYNPVNPIIGGCAGTRYGCCPNNKTAKMNPQGTNCIL